MKRMMLLAAMMFTMVGAAVASDALSWKFSGGMPQYGTLEIKDPEGFNGVLSLTPEAKAFDLVVGSTQSHHRVGIGFLVKNDTRRKAFALRGKYSFIPSISIGRGKTLFSETSGAGGLLDAAYLTQGGVEEKFKFAQMLYGYEQYVGLNWNVGKKHSFGIKGGGRWSGANLKDDYGSVNQWDNYGMGFTGYGRMTLAKRLRLRAEVEGWRMRYNPDRYFFVEKWTEEYEFRSELSADVSPRLELVPMLNYKKVDIERNRRADLVRVEYGGRVMMKDLIPMVSTAYVKGVHAPWRHKKGSESLLAFGASSGDWSGELYQRSIHDVYSTFSIDERIVGFQISLRFGGEPEKLSGMDDYGRVRKNRFQFYRDSGIEDVPGLNRTRQAERLGTMRKRNEWSGKNFSYKFGIDDGPNFRYADQVYVERGGDCNEQSCHNNAMDIQNGYRAFSGAWWDFNRSFTGHAVGLAQDPDTGEWFWDEYGQVMKVRNVGKNSTREEVMKEALKQNHRFSALPLTPGSDGVYFRLDDCSQQGVYDSSPFIWLGAVPASKERPNVEYGYELFTRKGFLFGDDR